MWDNTYYHIFIFHQMWDNIHFSYPNTPPHAWVTNKAQNVHTILIKREVANHDRALALIPC